MSIPILIAGRDYELKLPKEKLSYSQIDLYLQCPARYKQQYVLGRREDYSVYLAEGQAFTRLMEATLLRKLKKGKHLTVQDALKTYETVATEELAKVVNWAGDNEANVRERAEGFIRDLWKGPGPPYNPIMFRDKPGAEWEIDQTIAGVPFTGFIDVIEDGCITDFKVASEARRYNAEKSLQLDIYAFCTQISECWYTVFEKKTGKRVAVRADKDLARINQWVPRIIATVAQAISAGAFPVCNPANNFLCAEKWCPFWSECYGLTDGVKS